MDWKPFDPRYNTPQDVGLGGPSTEYLFTERLPDGRFMNFPSIWWDQSGSPHLDERGAFDRAMQYERESGEMFPRYYPAPGPHPEKFAVDAAINRSHGGGASQGRLVDTPPQLLRGVSSLLDDLRRY